MEKRILGSTDERLSVIGFGGMVIKREKPGMAKRYVSEAIDRGINYFDVAPEYGDAQEKLGPALRPYRQSCFLACKTLERTAEDAEKDLHRSLRLLKTDYFDLYQFHYLKTLEEVQKIMGPGGAMETFLKARKNGLIRYIGFSAHTEEAALAMMDSFGFDSILFPFNWACWYAGEFGHQVLKKAEEKKIGVLAIKALANRKLGPDEEKVWKKLDYVPVSDPGEAEMAVRFVLSKPVTSAVSPGHAELLWWACEAAEDLRPITMEEEEILKKKASRLEPFFHKYYQPY